VSYTYKSDATHKRQFGLIAADVDKVYPELVVNNARGEPETVQYHELMPILLAASDSGHRSSRVNVFSTAASSQPFYRTSDRCIESTSTSTAETLIV
jgi:hypothetical protein